MLTSSELELRSTLTLGKLESNAEGIRTLVLAKLADYTPELYAGKAAEAKADRAVLNNAEKALNARRLELEREYMEPFNKFKTTITETCKAIKQASAGLDEIVKAEEERERAEKLEKIQRYWDSTGFTMYTLDRVLDSKWLNKTAKLKDVQAAIDEIQQKTFTDLKILDNFPAEDVPLLKTVYLDTLSITEAMHKADQLKANRDRLAREKVEREAIEQAKALAAQTASEREEIKAQEVRAEPRPDNLASMALGLEIKQERGDDRLSFALVFHGTRDSLLRLRQFMTDTGITYEKLESKEAGVFTKA